MEHRLLLEPVALVAPVASQVLVLGFLRATVATFKSYSVCVCVYV
jgi:hypothetical protein